MGSPHFYLFSPIESVISISISRILNCILSKHFDCGLFPFIFIFTHYLHPSFLNTAGRAFFICWKNTVTWLLNQQYFLMIWPNSFPRLAWQDKIWDVFLAWDQGAKTHQPRLLYWAQRIKSFQSLFRFSLHWNSLCSIQYGWCFFRQRLQWLIPMVIQPFKYLRLGVFNVSRSLV